MTVADSLPGSPVHKLGEALLWSHDRNSYLENSMVEGWPTLGSTPMTFSSLLICSLEPSFGQSFLIATQVSDAACSTDMEARA